MTRARWTIHPLELHEGGIGYEVIDEKGDLVFDDQTYYPSAPSAEHARLIVEAVNAYRGARP